MTTAAEHAARGRAVKRSGDRTMREGIQWLRQNGAPQASRMASPNMGDVAGGPPAVIEITNESWDQIGKKARQAEGDAAIAGVSRWCIWKPRRREPGDTRPMNMGRAWCLTEFAQWWADQRELAELRARVEAYRDLIGNVR